jgi:hypothetical protein
MKATAPQATAQPKASHSMASSWMSTSAARTVVEKRFIRSRVRSMSPPRQFSVLALDARAGSEAMQVRGGLPCRGKRATRRHFARSRPETGGCMLVFWFDTSSGGRPSRRETPG